MSERNQLQMYMGSGEGIFLPNVLLNMSSTSFYSNEKMTNIVAVNNDVVFV